jgi:hypothetical protein
MTGFLSAPVIKSNQPLPAPALFKIVKMDCINQKFCTPMLASPAD